MPPLFPSLRSPDEAQIVTLGEATHGNREFQQLRLDVFQVLAEKYGVRAFALEGDFGGCEAIDRYIHGSGVIDSGMAKVPPAAPQASLRSSLSVPAQAALS